ncbi:hypothetical protein AMS68_005332 [Peltaster fructicola]|uniref:Cwf19-like C-terminal domain-containing protein n=1 Tax=Peltaster fructicola TaxID=286661 RepID=A0A6H0XYS5_9PEZI|nr:hypothetical protein AMS68_005332 [Peltaster fructicola]
MAAKICVCGDINGQFREVFAKIEALHKKQNFAFIIVAGNFFKEEHNGGILINTEAEELIKGKIEINVPVYFSLGRQELPSTITDHLDDNNGELCSNLFALGRRGYAKTTEGIRVVAVSGRYADSSMDRPASLYAGGYTDGDVKGSCGYNTADILITSDWPKDIEKGDRQPCAGPMGSQRASLADLCTVLSPRYHISTSQAFYQRQPFFHNKAEKPITRFIALAPFGNQLGEKWIYAFTIDPSAEAPAQMPPGVTASPLVDSTSNNKRKLGSQQEAFSNHRFATGDRHGGSGGRRDNKRRKKDVMPAACFFCLSNPTCETHMIGSIGEDAYITVSKGPLPKANTFPSLGFPGHMLIIPLIHAPTVSAIPGEDASAATLIEMTRYQDALQKMIAAQSKDGSGRSQLGAVTWEISRAGGVHNHWQFLPVPVDLVQKGTIEAAFKAEADAQDYPAFMTEEDKITAIHQGNCFKIKIWSEDSSKEMAMALDVSFKFDLQFGRRVLGKLLGLGNRANWKDCAQEKSEEEADVEKFKELFKPYDFTLS